MFTAFDFTIILMLASDDTVQILLENCNIR